MRWADLFFLQYMSFSWKEVYQNVNSDVPLEEEYKMLSLLCVCLNYLICLQWANMTFVM